MWKCIYFPWHKMRTNKIYETGGEQIICSCGRKYAMSARTRSLLHWNGSFEALYEKIRVIKNNSEMKK